ncbi:MAG: M20/M25/M40 family metallo-hydrolase [Oscillospiraceae bacterium]|jgi:endoglucanase|nr:M20/M25/M40 family metallo-hydrolase [Oscillospiraceae bacterium]
MEDLLRTLTAAAGVSGREEDAAETAARLLRQHCGDVRRDALGSVVGTRPGRGPRILLDAHLDQIGMAVVGHEPGGFLRVAPCGGMDARCVAAQSVIIHGRRDFRGIIPAAPPHLKHDGEKSPEWNDILIDTGLSDAAAEIPLGSRVSLCAPPRRLLGERFTAPSLDDRTGVAAILRCLELLGDKPACPLAVQLSVQEEVGGAGARAAAFRAEADEALVVDVSFAWAPGAAREEAQGTLGGGVMIGVSPTLDETMSEALEALARRNNIPYTIEVMSGRTGTNADRIQQSGPALPCALLSIPLRNMHTAGEIVDLRDIESTARLMAAYLTERGTA